MSRCYTVVTGDNLTVIAARFGLGGWRAIYDHPWNAAFRRRRPDPDLIFPGDVIYIPDPHEATGTRTFSFVRRAVAAASIDIIEDDNGDFIVGAAEPAAALVRMGIWDQAYDGAGNIRNGVAEGSNFVGRDTRRFYFRVRDPGAAGSTVTIQWRTLLATGAVDDAPASQDLTLTRTAAGSHVYVSKAVMLVTNDLDATQGVNSGLPAAHANAGNRTRGQADHRLRRARIDGMVQAEYTPSGGGGAVRVIRPVFSRAPDERRSITARVIFYADGTSAVPAAAQAVLNALYIAFQFLLANQIWNAVGLQINVLPTAIRTLPAGAINAAGQYTGQINNAQEQAAMADLIPITPDDTLTVVFCNMTTANAYTTVGLRTAPTVLGNRFFIFCNLGLALTDLTLAHEMHHLLFNRFDDTVTDEFISFNTNPPTGVAAPRALGLPDVRIERRIQQLNNATPNQDFCADNIISWYRRTRLVRHIAGTVPAGTGAADDSTGNTLVRPF